MGFSIKPKNTPRAYFYDASITLTIAAIFIFFLINTAVDRFQFIRTAAHADGVVHTSFDAKHHYDIRFTTADGRDIVYRESNLASYEDGEKVAVFYDPKNPDEIHSTSSFLALWNSTMILSWISFVCVFISLGLIYFPKYFYGPFSNAYERKLKREKARQ
jgi:hypothetical protein